MEASWTEVNVVLMVFPKETLPLFEVPEEALDVVEHVDFFLVNDALIFPPAEFKEVESSGIKGGELGVTEL